MREGEVGVLALTKKWVVERKEERMKKKGTE